MRRGRSDFAVVGLEQEVTLTLAGTQFNLRVDRIDRDEATNRLLVIDYKTGEVRPKRLLDDRLTEPQLPMYALTDERVGAVLFAKVGSDEAKVDGFAEQALNVGQPVGRPDDLADQERSWEALRTRWQSQLEGLLQEHRTGRAAVAPYPQPQRSLPALPLAGPVPHQRLAAANAGMSDSPPPTNSVRLCRRCICASQRPGVRESRKRQNLWTKRSATAHWTRKPPASCRRRPGRPARPPCWCSASPLCWPKSSARSRFSPSPSPARPPPRCGSAF